MSQFINFSSTSSGPLGYSSQKEWLGCGALAKAKETQRKQDKEAGVIYPPFPEDDKKPVNTLLGSLFGELVQRYHRGEPVSPSAQFSWDGLSLEQSHPLTCKAVRNLLDEYMRKTPVDAFGTIVGCEVPCRIGPELFGQELTGAIDAVTEDERGIWITDWKTEGRQETWLRTKYGMMHQNWLYALAYELETGVKPIGVRYVVVVKTAKVPVINLEFEGVTPTRFEWLRRFFDTVERRRKTPIAEPSMGNCIQYNRPCTYMTNEGVCGLL